MKKKFKTLTALVFSLMMIFSTAFFSFAASKDFTSLKATSTPTSVTLSWSEISNATKYEVQRYGTDKTWVTIASVSASNTSYTVKNLKPNTTYTFKIKATYRNFLSSKTVTSKNISKATTVIAPTKLKAESNSYNSIKLSWTKAKYASGYRIETYNASKKTWTAVKNVSAKTSSYVISSLKNNTAYKYRIKTYYTLSGKTYYSAPTPTVSAKALTPAVKNLKAVASSNTVTLSWSKVPSAKGYMIYRFDEASEKWITLSKNTTATSFKVKNLKPGMTYKFKVRAFEYVSKKYYYSAYSSVNCAVNLGEVTGVENTASGLTYATITWNKLSGADVYYVYRLENSAWSKIATTKECTYTDKNLDAGKQYQYRVRGAVKVDSSYKNGKVSETCIAFTNTLPKVSNLTIVPTTDSSKITLNWSSSLNAKEYEVYLNGELFEITNTTSSILPLSKDETHFKVRAVGYDVKGGKKAYSDFSEIIHTSYSKDFQILRDSSNKIYFALGSAFSSPSGYTVSYKAGRENPKVLSFDSGKIAIPSLEPERKYTIKFYKGKTATSANLLKEITISYSDNIIIEYGENSSATLSWKEVPDASYYSISYMDSFRQWKILSGAAYLTEANYTDYIDDSYLSESCSSKLYKVTAFDNKGTTIKETESILATNSSLYISKDNYKVTISWNPIPGCSTYRLYKEIWTNKKDKTSYAEILSTKNTSITLYLAPGTVHSFSLFPDNAGSVFSNLLIDMPEITFDGKSNENINSQLLLFSDTLNAARRNQSEVTVDKTVTSNYTISNLILTVAGTKIANCETTAEVQRFFDAYINDGSANDMKAVDKEVASSTVTFNDGIGYKGVSKTYLHRFVEPSKTTNVNNLFELPGITTSPSNWSKLFSSVKTTDLSGGQKKITMVLKKETVSSKAKPVNHNLFYDAENLSFLGTDEVNITSGAIGSTTIEAILASDGTLKKYTINSPYDVTVNFSEGEIVMAMSVKGSTIINYTFS